MKNHTATSPLNAFGLAMVVTALVCAPVSTTQAQTLIEFTTAEGYTNGALNGQNGWTSAGYTVGDASGAGEVTVGPLTELGKATLNAGWPSADTATEYSVKSTMSFARDNASTEFRDFYFNQIAFGNDTIRVGIGRKNESDQYVVAMQTSGGSGLKSSGNIAGTKLGFADAADTLSDNLSFSLSITHAAGSTNWLVSATVKNEDTSAILATWSVEEFTQTSAFSTGALTPQIMAGRGTSGLSDITIHSLEYTVSTDP